MSDPYVREVGRVEDMDGVPLVFGVDHDCVTIGPHCFTAGQMEEVGRVLVSAVWQAGQQAGYGRGRDDEAAGLDVDPLGGA